MELDFKNAWDKYFAPQRANLTKEQCEAYERFALSNRKRALDFINLVQNYLKIDMKGKRLLDIGSAYGGIPISAAALGSEAYGIEILENLHKLALANAFNEAGDVKLINSNVLDDRVLSLTGLRPFDVITINDVFEHIYNSYALFNRIKDFSCDNTIVYFAIPNGDCWQAIEKEGHKFMFGLTLLEPGAWAELVGPFNIYYRPFGFYQLHFHFIGYPYLYIIVEKKLLDTAKSRVKEKYYSLEQKTEQGIFKSNHLNNSAKQSFSLLKQQLVKDIEGDNHFKIHLLYDSYFWTGFAARSIIPELENNENVCCLTIDKI